MAGTSNLEKTIGGWYKSVPHLPKNGQKWLADNIWWLALVGAVLSVLGALALIPLFLGALAVTSLATGLTGAYAPALTATYTGFFFLGAIVGLVALLVRAVILFMAFGPLKDKKKRGWTLLFWGYLIGFGLSIVGDLVAFNIMSVVFDVLFAAVAGYFLFEIHGYFEAKAKEHHEKAEAK